MDLKYLLLGIIMLAAGAICIYAYSKIFIKDTKIRKNAKKLTGKIIGMKSHYRFSFIPIFKSDQVKNTLTSPRTITSLKHRLESHKLRIILYNPDYPNECTHGHRFTMLIEFILMMLISAFLIVLGLNSIAMFISH